MIKIESDNNIAVVSMDEYSQGKKAITELGALKAFMQCEYSQFDDGYKPKYNFVYLKDEYKSYVSCFGEISTEDLVIFNKDDYESMLHNVTSQLKDDNKKDIERENKSLSDKEHQLNVKQKDFDAKLKKAKNIKWYHLLFGWKVLKFD